MKYYMVMSFIMLMACDLADLNKFEIISSPQGIYRLNKRTGEISLVEGYTITYLKEPIPILFNNSPIELSDKREWPSINISTHKDLKCVLCTSWREGKLYFRIFLKPYGSIKYVIENKSDYLSSFRKITVNLYDKNTFNLKDIEITLNSMSKQIDENNKPVALESNNSIQCTSEIYSSIAGWNVTWNF